MVMYVVWRCRCGGFTGISRVAEMCPGFPSHQTALVTVVSREKGLWVVWCNSGEVRFKKQGKENLSDWNTVSLLRLLKFNHWGLAKNQRRKTMNTHTHTHTQLNKGSF